MQQALLALLEDRPLEAITGAMIAQRAKIGYATFFRHYADVLAADSGGAAHALVDAVATQRVVIRSVLAGAGDAWRAEIARQVIERVTALPDLSPSWLPRRLATRVAVMSTIELLDWWLREEPERDPREVAALLDRLVIGWLAETSPE
jgi:AcrR family transcriptional regulator